MTRVGEGAYVYEAADDWARLPDGARFGWTHGVVVDSQDRVYVHNRSPDAVAVFERDGTYLGSWGAEFAGGAHGLFLESRGGEEHLWLADPERHLVAKATLDGEILLTLGVPPLPEVYFGNEDAPAGEVNDPGAYRPTDVAVAPDGDVYVCDGYGQFLVHRYDADGTYLASWGGKGSGAGELDEPHGIWVDTRGAEPLVYVADRENRRFQVFTTEGEHVRFVSEGVDFPCDFYEWNGDLYVADLLGKLAIYDRDDGLVTFVGAGAAWQREGWPHVPPRDWATGEFIAPHAACVDSRGDVYVAEWVPEGRVTKLVRM